jgi:hypothetical protein
MLLVGRLLLMSWPPPRTYVCTGETFSGFTLVSNTPDDGVENDVALTQLLDGDIDALWMCKY